MAGKNLKISILSYFFISCVLGGLQRLSGLFVWELLQSMNLSRQNATIPFTFSWAVANIMASFSDCSRENKKSEYVILFGVLLTASGAALCMLTTNVTTLMIFWGFIFGSGYGIASPHLFRHLTNVNSGKLSFFLHVTPSLGVTVMPFVLHMLTSYYGLQGSFLIISGIILNYLPLSVAAAYNIELRLPNFNWRVRKKSSQYVVRQQESGHIVSNESFVNSLEPDLILKINPNDEGKDDSYSDIDNSVFAMKEVFSIGRKRSETRGNDLQSLEMDPRLFSPNANHSAMIDEMQNYENRRKLFEGSFSNKDIIRLNGEKREFKGNCTINCDTSNSTKILEENILNTEQNFKQSEVEISQTQNENKDSISVMRNTEHEKKTGHDILPQTGTENEENLSLVSSDKEKPKTEEASVKEDLKQPSNLQNEQLKIPLDIKVHVEEYTFVCDRESLYANPKSNYEKNIKNSYRNHSNSLMSEMYENIDFTCEKFAKNLRKSSELYNPKLSNIYTISEKSEFHDKQIYAEQNNNEIERNKWTENVLKYKSIFKFLNEITSPGCLCIILVSVIFEMNLVTLVTMFADFGNDIDDDHSDFKWILVAFGAGGIAGKFCCCKISRTIPEKSHAVGVILFLLAGLSTAGVLFSTNSIWLACFYGILGALEGGITYIIPKFILEYIDRNIHSTLYSVKSFLSGIAIISIPYIIGLCRDELGDYEFLLQTLSCSSILCALLVYFLPCLSTASDKRLPTSFRDKMEMA